MTVRQFISILLGRWWIAALCLVVITGATLAASLLWPKKYTATASVVIDVKPDPIAAMAYAGMASPAYMATQVEIIQSDRVATRVVRNLRLAENADIRRQWTDQTGGEGSIEAWLADTFQRSMDVKPSRESNVITVMYSAADPRFAAGLANAYVQAYMDTALDLRVNPAKQYSAFFDTRSKNAREALEKAQAKLSGFQQQKGIIATDERLAVENGRLTELSSQVVVLQSLSADSTSRQGAANGVSADRMTEVLSNPVIGALKADISRQESKLRELSARLGDSNPQVVEMKAGIAELRNRLADETARVTSGVAVTSTINRSREARIREELEAQRAKVLRLKQVRDEGAVLNREVEIAQKSYDLVMQRLDQSSLESQSTQGNVSVLTPASVPLKPSSPRVLQNTLLSLLVGGLIGVGAVLLLELADRRVRGMAGIPELLQLPVIGVMPAPSRRRMFGRKQALLGRQKMVRQLTAYPAAKGA